jgi:hypothetical protein
MSAARLPEFLRPYFWDTDFDRLDPVEHERFIAERLMEKTTQKSFRWLLALVRRKLPQEAPARPSIASSSCFTNFGWRVFPA